MTKVPFKRITISETWGRDLPDGDYTIGRGADPRAPKDRSVPITPSPNVADIKTPASPRAKKDLPTAAE